MRQSRSQNDEDSTGHIPRTYESCTCHRSYQNSVSGDASCRTELKTCIPYDSQYLLETMPVFGLCSQNTAALGQHPKCINTTPYLPPFSRNTYTAKADASFYLDWDQILTIKIQGYPHPFTAAGVGTQEEAHRNQEGDQAGMASPEENPGV